MSWSVAILEIGVIPGVPLTVYLPDAPPGAVIDPPCYCYLASDGSTNILIDSGPDQAASAAAGLQINGDTTALLAAGLRAWGVTPADIDMIVHTHLHYDHMQNDLLFPRASVVVQRAELAWATSPDGGPFYCGVSDLSAALSGRLRLLDGETDVLPGVTALPNGGHTPGHQSVLVQTADGPACVCGDIVSLRANLRQIGSVCPDVAATSRFLDRASATDWEMLPSHDPEYRGHRWYLRLGGEPGQAAGGAAPTAGIRRGQC